MTMFPVLPEAAKLLLPAIKTYVSNISFEGTWDVRVLDRAKTLRVAVWLHRLDMAVGGTSRPLKPWMRRGIVWDAS